jgi:molecular chaperone DnaJ
VDDYYALLGIDRRSRPRELRRAFRKLALKWHPDRAVRRDGDVRRIHAAYTVLADPISRAAYDRRTEAARRPITAGARRPSSLVRLSGQHQRAVGPGGPFARDRKRLIELYLQ